MNDLWVQVFEGSWLGNRSREVVRESFYWMAFVDLVFFCWPRRWPLMLALEFLRCFEMMKAVRPGQVLKWSQLMERSKVDVMVLNNVPWKNAARSDCFGA